MKPKLGEFRTRSRKGNVIPVSVELPADLETPVSIFLKLARKLPHSFLLESVELEEKLGRFSMIGMNPELVLEYADGIGTLTRKGKKKEKIKSNFLSLVQTMLKEYRFVPDPDLPALVGGLVGYVGYELVAQFEAIQPRSKSGLPLPDAALFFPTNLVVFDHIKHRLKLIHLARVTQSVERVYQQAVRSLETMAKKLERRVPGHHLANISRESTHRTKVGCLHSNMTRAHFERMVQKTKSYIRAGDCIQVVLSQRFDLGFVSDDFKVYRSLRSLNPSPYMFYFRNRLMSLVGSSPEMLAKKTGRRIEVRPIAGTRPRGKSDVEDVAYESALRTSRKEMAEHLMLVDLGRNDLGRVARASSVRVDHFARIERYSHVMHLVSDVRGALKSGRTALDLFEATFPAGTVTGAPKIRAMEIIDELEDEKRGPYAGSLGYFSLTGDMDMCITIRTVVIYRKRAYVQAGAGIVNDSIPRNEYRETINKAKALFQSVQMSRG
ncbi:MAG: anthranilate synthase component I [Omnitrophica bacterium RIFCSPLOWO2_12_FULL_50_11]|nr:MAG: anthranilate synthase component I [Omnitrophica bacterium RIFCSPLOWO2_12_FULL_50_11]